MSATVRMFTTAICIALGAAVAVAAPAKALVSFAGTIDATLEATSAPKGVSISYGFSNYEGYADGFGSYDADWSDDYVVEGDTMRFSPSVDGSTDALAVIDASSLNDGSVKLENLTNAISTVDFVLSYDLQAMVERGDTDAAAKAYASLMIETTEAEPSVSRSVDIYAGGDYGPDLARETGAWSFQIVLKPGESQTLSIYADAMGRLERSYAAEPEVVPLPGSLPLAAAGIGALGGVAALRRRRRDRG